MSRYASVNDLPPQMREQVQRQLGKEARAATFEIIGQPCEIDVTHLRSTAKVPPMIGLPEPTKPRKYRNTRVQCDGEWFDSKLEYDCFCWLKLRKAAGEIAWFIRQVPFVLEGGVRYRADFMAMLTDEHAPVALVPGQCSAVEVWDAKGRDTQASINKRKQVLARYGAEVQLWTKENRNGSRT